MKFITIDVQAGHFLVGHRDTLWIGAGVQRAANHKPRLRFGGADQFDNYPVADQGPGLPAAILNGYRRGMDFALAQALDSISPPDNNGCQSDG